jgi:hypothetical protein
MIRHYRSWFFVAQRDAKKSKLGTANHELRTMN